MSLAVLAFVAGILTILAPCILPLLPAILGGAVVGRKWWSPLVVISSFLVSVLCLTVGIKFLIDTLKIDQNILQLFSTIILFCFGLVLIFPSFWGKILSKTVFQSQSISLLHKHLPNKNVVGLVILGVVLGPVFISCSPTYFLILGVIIPQNLLLGIGYLSLYLLGIGVVLLTIAYLGRKIFVIINNIASDTGVLKRGIGVLIILFSILMWTGHQKKLESWLLDQGWIGVTDFEFNIIEEFNSK